MTGSATLHTPEVRRHQPIDLVTARATEAVYAAPAAFHAAPAALLEHRRAQDYAVELIDVAAIYDVWSYSQVDPAALRRVMQHGAPRCHDPGHGKDWLPLGIAQESGQAQPVRFSLFEWISQMGRVTGTSTPRSPH